MMREYNKTNGIRSDRPMSTTEIIIAGDNLRAVERAAKSSGTYGPVANTILTSICVVGMVVFFIVPLIMEILRW